jgi:hypothetical protein
MKENKVAFSVLIAAACFMTLGIFISTYFYEKSDLKTMLEPIQPIEEPDTLESPQPTPLQPIYETNSIGYSIQNEQLQITYNKGQDWIEVPVDLLQLFAGEYNGTEQELIPNSYILTPNLSAFLVSGSQMKLKYTRDQGKTWEESIVKENNISIRFRKVVFLNDSFGYVILSNERTMSQEWTTVHITNDGGKHWRETTHLNVTRLIYDGGFVDENTGFLSFGILNPVEPDLYVTQDAGSSWNKATITIPEQYHEIFVMAEAPIKEGDYLTMYINQGPNGDYQGGKIKGKFISTNNGQTWTFSEEVQPNETEE